MSRKSPSSRRIRRRKCGMNSILVTAYLKKTGPSSTLSISSGTTRIARPARWNLCSNRASAPAMEKTGLCGRRKSSSPREEPKKIFPAYYWARFARDGPPRRDCPIFRWKCRPEPSRSAALSPEAVSSSPQRNRCYFGPVPYPQGQGNQEECESGTGRRCADVYYPIPLVIRNVAFVKLPKGGLPLQAALGL